MKTSTLLYVLGFLFLLMALLGADAITALFAVVVLVLAHVEGTRDTIRELSQRCGDGK